MNEKDRYWFWLCNIENIWNGKIRQLLERFGSPEAVYRGDIRSLESISALTSIDIENIKKSKDCYILDKKIEYLREKSIYFISRDSLYYPEGFRRIIDFPYGFYAKGSLELLRQTELLPVVSIVGTRRASVAGAALAKQFGMVLGMKGAIVVSGMARGIDSKAHIGTLESGGKTIAVLGSGVDICYPRENMELYNHIAERGLLLSEYPCKTPPNSWQFPLRNRLISALADRIVVVEAKKKSGSLITASYGLEQGKDIYAVPGRPGDCISEGCNQLIKQGAGLLTHADELLEIPIPGKNIINDRMKKDKKKILLEKEMEMVYSNVDLIPKRIEDILEASGVEPGDLNGILVRLQMMDLIAEPIKNYYVRQQ